MTGVVRRAQVLCVALEERLGALPSVTAVKSGLAQHLSQTGEPYEEFRFVNGNDAADALSAIQDEITHYAAERTGTLYWRVRPEAQQLKGAWGAYARLLISDKPEVL